jgi:hypothetical protein
VIEPADTVRLHITPFDANLLPAVLPASVRPKAANISYHTLEAFSDKRYGFVDLPAAEAERVRKRLNGSILKGVKMRIEKARRSDMPSPAGVEALAEPNAPQKKEKNTKKTKDKSKKRKRDGEEIVGAEIEDGRKVKRGWTTAEEPVSRRDRKRERRKDAGGTSESGKKAEKKRKQAKSQFTEEPEVLFKTVLPHDPAAVMQNGEADDFKKKDKRNRKREVVIHEFENTTRFPTFLKDAEPNGVAKKATEYVDGQGWIDEDGNVVEEVKTRRKARSDKKSKPTSSRKVKVENPKTVAEEEDKPNEQTSVAAAPADEAEKPAFVVPAKPAAKTEVATPVSILKSSPSRPKSSGSARSLTIKIPPPPSTPTITPATGTTASSQAVVHPLEALYKRPRDANGEAIAEQTEGFSFFTTDASDHEDGEPGAKPLGVQMPMTPYTRADFEWRGQRSAAPTPDTAFASRSFKFWAGDGERDDEEESNGQQQAENDVVHGETDEDESMADAADEEEEAEKVAAVPAALDKEKWFWEQRGDLNRAWRTRKRMYAKEKRYRGNKARAERV